MVSPIAREAASKGDLDAAEGHLSNVINEFPDSEPAQTAVPFGNGLRCVAPGGTGFFRFETENSGPEGVLTLGPGAVGYVCATQPAFCITAGSTWNFQNWYRDPGGSCGESFNLSNATSVLFGP